MGECGCGSTNLLFRFPGPNGSTYGLEVYESCHYCHTPVGVVLHRIDDDSEIGEQLLEQVPEPYWMEYDSIGMSETVITIIDPENLVKELEERLDEDGDMTDLPERRLFAHALPEAVRTSLGRWTGVDAGGA